MTAISLVQLPEMPLSWRHAALLGAFGFTTGFAVVFLTLAL